MPAFFNGVFGHKPTGGLVPNTGQHPSAVNEALRYLTTGVLTRKAEDIWPLINLLAGPDGLDEGCQKIELGDPSKVNFSDITVTMIEGNGAIPVKADMLTAMRNAANALANRGAQVKTAKLDKLKNSRNIWSSMLSAAGGPSFSELLGEGKPIKSYLELGKWMLRISDYTVPAILLSILEKVPKLTPKASEQAIEQGKQLRQEMVELIGPKGLLLYPSYPSVAPEHYKPMFPPFNWVYTAILNVMEIPVTQVPLGLNSAGLPLGVQVGAVHGNDHMTVAAALALEEDLGGWVFPSTKF
jgi:fatty acid amide hydrolase 2